MKKIRTTLLLVALIFTVAALPQGTTVAASANGPKTQPSQPPPTIASALDREISQIDRQIAEAAKAMPEDKFNFSPESLNIPGDDYNSQTQAQVQAPRPARSRADETLEMWKDIGNKLIAMAQDFPEDKYGFKLQNDQRSFAQNLLHIAAVDYDLICSVSGSNVGPDFGKNKHNPSQDVYKTKADVLKLIQQAVADGANVIQQQGDAGLDKVTKYAWGNKLVHNSYTWMWAIEHSGEHYGQLVVYYRANNLVPPDSRR
jgi:uncharacterized damage-inducible protein DinB